MVEAAGIGHDGDVDVGHVWLLQNSICSRDLDLGDLQESAMATANPGVKCRQSHEQAILRGGLRAGTQMFDRSADGRANRSGRFVWERATAAHGDHGHHAAQLGIGCHGDPERLPHTRSLFQLAQGFVARCEARHVVAERGVEAARAIERSARGVGDRRGCNLGDITVGDEDVAHD